jgi:hypothetical protein
MKTSLLQSPAEDIVFTIGQIPGKSADTLPKLPMKRKTVLTKRHRPE